MKLVIIGGVAGGASAAARARRLAEDAEIVLFERGPDVSFANCGLPYYIGGSIARREKLLVTTAERLHERFNLDVRTLVGRGHRPCGENRSRPRSGFRAGVRRALRQVNSRPRGSPRAAAHSRHRSARDLHPAKPARRRPDQGRDRPRRQAGRGRRRRLYRAGTGREPRAPGRGHDACRIAGPGLAAAGHRDDHADRRRRLPPKA